MSNTMKEIDKIYKESGFLKAKIKIDEVIKENPRSPDGLAALFLRARGYEGGWYGTIDYVLAKNDYKLLIENKNKVGSKCLLGYARVLFKEESIESFDEIKRLCDEAIALDGNIKARFLLGFSYEKFNKDYASAASYYLSSFFHGSKWGLGFYSSAKIRDGKFVIGLVSKIAYHLMYPILNIFDRSKSAIYYEKGARAK